MFPTVSHPPASGVLPPIPDLHQTIDQATADAKAKIKAVPPGKMVYLGMDRSNSMYRTVVMRDSASLAGEFGLMYETPATDEETALLVNKEVSVVSRSHRLDPPVARITELWVKGAAATSEDSGDPFAGYENKQTWRIWQGWTSKLDASSEAKPSKPERVCQYQPLSQDES